MVIILQYCCKDDNLLIQCVDFSVLYTILTKFKELKIRNMTYPRGDKLLKVLSGELAEEFNRVGELLLSFSV